MVHRPTVFLRPLVPVALSVAAICLATPQLLMAQTAERAAKTELAAAAIAPTTGGKVVARLLVADGHPALFFGYVEFDQDPDAPGGVPGFGPWPPSGSQGAAAEPSR